MLNGSNGSGRRLSVRVNAETDALGIPKYISVPGGRRDRKHFDGLWAGAMGGGISDYTAKFAGVALEWSGESAGSGGSGNEVSRQDSYSTGG